MSKTKPVTCADRGFWGYDVAVGIFLKYLIDAAEASGERALLGYWKLFPHGACRQSFQTSGSLSMNTGPSTSGTQLLFSQKKHALCSQLGSPYLRRKLAVGQWWMLSTSIRVETKMYLQHQ